MISVASLLNPVPPAFQDYRPSSSPYSPPPGPRVDSPLIRPYKKQKTSKDAAIFSKGKVYGEIRYSPCEVHDEKIAAEHQKFQLYPVGQIAEYRRHIPYNSEKKSFLEKTGRESFEGVYFDGVHDSKINKIPTVYQYTFKMPDEEREYTVMWDYNVGLVRITPFFKCCQYAKVSVFFFKESLI